MAVKPVIPQILKTQEAEHGLRQVFGSLRFWDALIVTLLVVTLGWLTDSTYNFLLTWALAKLPVAAPLRQVAAWVLLILPFFLLFFFARWKLQAKEAAPLLQQVDNPQVEGLILFLSRPRENEVENFRQVNATLRDGGGRDGISGVVGPWKLPLVTIERCTTAKALLVIDSAGKEGSRVVREEFLQLLGRLLPNRKFEILKPEDLVPECAGGIDFFDVHRLAADIPKLATALQARLHAKPEELLIDIMSGTKAVTTAATIAGSRLGLLLNFVDPRTYEVSRLKAESEGGGK